MKKLKIGLIGFGTVGVGVYKTLQNFEEIEVVKIAVKNINKPRSIELPNGILTDNPYEIVNDENINVEENSKEEVTTESTESTVDSSTVVSDDEPVTVEENLEENSNEESVVKEEVTTESEESTVEEASK